jgi:integrase
MAVRDISRWLNLRSLCEQRGHGIIHGFRASELVDLQWNQIDFEAGTMAVRRAKKGSPSTHPIRGEELRALRRLAREQDPEVTVRVYFGARGTVHHGRVCPDGRACR